MTKDQIKYMAARFLGWRLPDNFSPDAGISFKKTYNEHTRWPATHTPSGTNLFDADQAEAMVQYMVEGLPTPKPQPSAGVTELCKELTHAAVLECERAVAQAIRNDGSAANGGRWDTCFGVTFKPIVSRFLAAFPSLHSTTVGPGLTEEEKESLADIKLRAPKDDLWPEKEADWANGRAIACREDRRKLIAIIDRVFGADER